MNAGKGIENTWQYFVRELKDERTGKKDASNR